ncbi:MAG: LiaI-LiaF-like domain-containing protein [Caldicoprobacterales bacterium]|jgi:hypothetical protein|nr:hypothetical protein [Clostridiales bacterium]
MFKGRRVGTLTTGIVLIAFGILFILRITFPQIEIGFILSLWPAILIFLGIEVLAHCIFGKEEQMKYDGGAIVLMFILAFFAMAMAGAEFILNNMNEFRGFL